MDRCVSARLTPAEAPACVTQGAESMRGKDSPHRVCDAWFAWDAPQALLKKKTILFYLFIFMWQLPVIVLKTKRDSQKAKRKKEGAIHRQISYSSNQSDRWRRWWGRGLHVLHLGHLFILQARTHSHTQARRGVNEPRTGRFVTYRHIFETFLTARSILCLTSCTTNKHYQIKVKTWKYTELISKKVTNIWPLT